MQATNKETYSAVVETGWHDGEYTRWEEARNCGHKHKTVEAAEKCGAKHYDAKYRNGSWSANAAWHNYRVHDSQGRRVV